MLAASIPSSKKNVNKKAPDICNYQARVSQYNKHLLIYYILKSL
jgi:hypothetical protein